MSIILQQKVLKRPVAASTIWLGRPRMQTSVVLRQTSVSLRQKSTVLRQTSVVLRQTSVILRQTSIILRQISTRTRPVTASTRNDGYIWLDRLRVASHEAGLAWRAPKYRSQLESLLDFRYPHEWFPQARQRKPRTIYCHVGPTNSGKTHAAIQRLKDVPRGVYCAPLRLLAMEMWEKLNRMGKRCALRTGEVTSGPVDDVKADYTTIDTLACTVEMLDPTREFDVAVIDEIQLISDEQRGWAFTQALLGVNAKEIFVCGEEAAVGLIQKIAAQSGDKVVVVKYQRLSPLIVSEKSLDGGFDQLRSGDCVVAFSRKRIFQTKLLVEMKTGKKCAVVYGNLPMENRTLQAKAFNERQQGFDIMIASDAIGMGLNLNIQRIIFHDIKQQSSDGLCLVPPSRIKQIGGRAGRFGFGKSEGLVTCFHDEDMEYMRKCMDTPNEEYKMAGIMPLGSKVEEICQIFPDLPLVAVLSAIVSAGRYSSHYFPCLSEDQRLVAYMLEEFPSLSIAERLILSSAPVQLRDPRIVYAFQWFIKGIVTKKPCPFRVDLGHHQQAMDHLGLAESFYRTLDLYLWLASRFPDIFTDREKVLEKREMCSKLVTKLLSQITFGKSHTHGTGMFASSAALTRFGSLDQDLQSPARNRESNRNLQNPARTGELNQDLQDQNLKDQDLKDQGLKDQGLQNQVKTPLDTSTLSQPNADLESLDQILQDIESKT